MYKFFYGLLAIMIIFIVVVSFFSLKIKLMERAITNYNNEISNNYAELQNLKAEWNYLNNPKYLEQMVDKYLPNMLINNNQNNTDRLISKIPFKNNN